MDAVVASLSHYHDVPRFIPLKMCMQGYHPNMIVCFSELNALDEKVGDP